MQLISSVWHLLEVLRAFFTLSHLTVFTFIVLFFFMFLPFLAHELIQCALLESFGILENLLLPSFLLLGFTLLLQLLLTRLDLFLLVRLVMDGLCECIIRSLLLFLLRPNVASSNPQLRFRFEVLELLFFIFFFILGRVRLLPDHFLLGFLDGRTL